MTDDKPTLGTTDKLILGIGAALLGINGFELIGPEVELYRSRVEKKIDDAMEQNEKLLEREKAKYEYFSKKQDEIIELLEDIKTEVRNLQ